MPNITWRELGQRIQELDINHIDDNVTLFDPNVGEFFGVKAIDEVGVNDWVEPGPGILDDGCIFLIEDV